ncbi:MAG: EAL domain-containing protein [Undibacterium sp.]|uniref:bifunctional diguanylate cyclase/phosphodiesterase n=1 Tax=Undibacterium sp. TaxID=1914977 RepID=UPI00272870B8|nr:EAL domain-containing protein [Undibacterium sp.]MDO8652224.1 EAL domain-containing protein [Undibacterium sp.]
MNSRLKKKCPDVHAVTIEQELSRALQRSAQAEEALLVIRASNDRLKTRFGLIREATSDGLWDMEINPSNLIDANNPIWWSDRLRQLLGFQGENDFPNILGSWSSLLHPDDLAPTLASFVAHINDRSSNTPYDVTFRLRCCNGEYRCFRARGKTLRASDGSALRVAGSLSDLTDRNAILGLKRYAEDIIANLPAGLIVADEALRVLSVNHTFREIFGIQSEEEIAGNELEAILPQPWLRKQAQGILADGTALRGIDVALGEKRLRVAIAGIRLEEEDRRLLVVAEDVTEEQRLREEARAHEARYRDQASLLDKATDAIIVRGIDHRILFWNKGAERLYGWTSEEAIGEFFDTMVYDDQIAFSEITSRVLDQGEWRGEVTQLRKDGSTFIVESQRTLVRDVNNQPQSILIINTDITQRKATDEKIRHLALYDIMTGLPNRTLFMDRLKQTLANAERHVRKLAILFMDLNRFKEINDTQGHDVGDQVLINVAQRFQSTLRGEETLARLGGDEFVIIAEVANQVAAVLIAERLQQVLAEPIAANGHTFSVGVSIGIAFYPDDGVTVEDLLKRADIAMYRAKALGGGYLAYQPEMSVGMYERMQIAKNLSRAIHAGELELYYQPKINLSTRTLNGAEALLRWNDSERGWISPAQFIPIAEARGMMGALGRWVLQEACRQLKVWQQAGLEFPGRLAVNLSAQQLEEPGIADIIQKIVYAAGLTPACLELELTESGLMGNVEQAIKIMQVLKTAGFSLSIDDFGTGYSSLSYLKRLPADTLKIDISFVRDMLKDRHDYTIVTTIIGMARNLGLKAIAEGVEELAQAEALLALGCDEAQGYYFGHPEPAHVFAQKWLATSLNVDEIKNSNGANHANKKNNE